MKDRVSLLPPEMFKNVRKKILKMHMPYCGYTHAMGYSGKNGAKILYYHTNILWQQFDKGIKKWDIAFQIADDLGPHKFIESGFHRHPKKKSMVYYMKISSTNKNGTFYSLLIFSELEGRLLYGLRVSPDNAQEQWIDTERDVLKDQYVSETIIASYEN